jgi:octaprenyl-diphosphate synthase
VGDDLAEGKPTLPLIQAMKTGTEEERQLLRQCIRNGGLDDLQPVLDIVHRSGAIDYTRAAAQRAASNAGEALAALPASTFKDTLLQLAQLAVTRTH